MYVCRFWSLQRLSVPWWCCQLAGRTPCWPPYRHRWFRTASAILMAMILLPPKRLGPQIERHSGNLAKTKYLHTWRANTNTSDYQASIPKPSLRLPLAASRSIIITIVIIAHCPAPPDQTAPFSEPPRLCCQLRRRRRRRELWQAIRRFYVSVSCKTWKRLVNPRKTPQNTQKSFERKLENSTLVFRLVKKKKNKTYSKFAIITFD